MIDRCAMLVMLLAALTVSAAPSLVVPYPVGEDPSLGHSRSEPS